MLLDVEWGLEVCLDMMFLVLLRVCLLVIGGRVMGDRVGNLLLICLHLCHRSRSNIGFIILGSVFKVSDICIQKEPSNSKQFVYLCLL